MPIFNPPLGRETTIPLASSDYDRFVHLSFTLAFELGEDASGSWELWTDIPDVDDEGHFSTGPGEWRAVPFAPIPSLHDIVEIKDSDASNEDGLVITLAPALNTAPQPIDHTLIAEMVVPANTASYFYTHRRVLESGETQWLGNGGDNGVVRVLECEATSKHIERKEWKGIGVELRDNESPIIHHLPVDDNIKSSILLLQSVPPVIQRIHQILDSPKKSETHNPESLVILSNDLRPVSIQRNSISPVAAGLQEHHDRHRPLTDILSDVCKDYKKIEVIKNTPEDIVAFVYRTKDDSPTAYLIAHNTLGRKGELAIPLSSLAGEGKVPLAIKEVSPTPSGSRFISAEDSQHIALDRSSSTTSSAQVFEIAQFITLPGKDSSYLIAAENALTQSIAENHHAVDRDSTDNTVKQNQDVDEFLNNASSSTLEEAVTLATHPTPQLSELPELIADDGESIDSGSESSISGPIKPVSFFSWLKRFFVGFWSWLFGPFGSKKSDGQSGDDTSGSGTITPNERTHLLSSSAATSSTAVSPFGSPEVGKVKAELAKVMYPEPTQSTQQTFASTFEDNDTAHVSYEALFTFAQAPFRFFFPPHTYTSNNLSLEYKRGASTSWAKATIPQSVEAKDGYCDEVTIDVDGVGQDDDKTLWEARWSVL